MVDDSGGGEDLEPELLWLDVFEVVEGDVAMRSACPPSRSTAAFQTWMTGSFDEFGWMPSDSPGGGAPNSVAS